MPCAFSTPSERGSENPSPSRLSPDKLLMPWKKLLKNERYFPNWLLPTSAFIAFLEEWQDGQKTGNPHIEAIISDWCSLKPDRVLDSELDSIIKKMINMKCCQSPGSNERAPQ